MKKQIWLVFLFVLAVSACFADGLTGIQTQIQIKKLVEQHSPARLNFVKDRPILGYAITTSTFASFPAVVQKYLGETDSTKYTDEYIKGNRGSIVALQMNGEKPDFYIIDLDIYKAKYRPVSLLEVKKKNSKMWLALISHDEVKALFKDKKLRLVGALKIQPVEMIKMSDIGYPVNAEVMIQSPWGGQTKPAGQEAYLVFDDSNDQFYMVNVDAQGLPIGYVSSK